MSSEAFMINPKPKPIKEKKEKKKRKLKSNKQLLEIKADRLIREIVFLRDSFCVCPPPERGHTDVVQPGHLITRGKKSVRWDLRNVNVQCSGCNLRHEFQSEIYTKWYLVEFGQESYVRLVEDAGRVGKISTDEMEKLCNELEGIIDVQKSSQGIYKPRFTQAEILSGAWRSL